VRARVYVCVCVCHNIQCVALVIIVRKCVTCRLKKTHRLMCVCSCHLSCKVFKKNILSSCSSEVRHDAT